MDKDEIIALAVVGGDFDLREFRKRRLRVKTISFNKAQDIDPSNLIFSSEDVKVNKYGIVTGGTNTGIIKIKLRANPDIEIWIEVRSGRRKDILEMSPQEIQEERDYKLEKELYGKKKGFFGWLCNKKFLLSKLRRMKWYH